MRIIVSGPIANKPGNGGIAWNVLSYVRGLQQLGHDVAFVESIAPDACTDAWGQPAKFSDSVNLAHFRTTASQLGLPHAILMYNNGEHIYGATRAEVAETARHADLLVNISGHLALEPPFDAIPCKLYIDEDPGYTQFWQVTGVRGLNLAGHDFYFTIGENIGQSNCTIPRGDYDWRPTRQPVVLNDWPSEPAPNPARFTTVASWRGAYGRVEYEGGTFGLKAHEFRRFITVPTKVREAAFEIALDIHPGDAADLEALHRSGWNIIDPSAIVADPIGFQRYVQGSGAEFSVAQGIYVETNSGWFSDRSARYLACGRPVLVQDTGFERNIPVGEGLLTFQTLGEAVASAHEILNHYADHAEAARALAESHFSSNRILSNLLEQVL